MMKTSGCKQYLLLSVLSSTSVSAPAAAVMLRNSLNIPSLNRFQVISGRKDVIQILS